MVNSFLIQNPENIKEDGEYYNPSDLQGLGDKPDYSNYKINKTIVEGKELKFKVAYGKIYEVDEPDYEIELDQIKRLETIVYRRKLGEDARTTEYINETEGIRKLAFHYKQICRMWFPELSAGWNRWSEDILFLCLCNKMHKVLWGSGNSGKSATAAFFLYVKYRVNPSERLIMVASRYSKDSQARVYGYIKKYHSIAPKSHYFRIEAIDTASEQNIRTFTWDAKASDGKGAYTKDELTGIVNVPLRVDLTAQSQGSNLLGRHPKDWLGIAFDECQQLGSSILEEEVYNNWLTNDNKDFYYWGNPSKVYYHDPGSWDLLFAKGSCQASVETLRNLISVGNPKRGKTLWWGDKNTRVLRFTMLDSPKNDFLEKNNIISDDSGRQLLRLHFLAGTNNAKEIEEEGDTDGPHYFGQVLGFPYIEIENTETAGCLTPFQIKQTLDYPFQWAHDNYSERKFCLGIDPSLTGYGDKFCICLIEIGKMLDGRWGVDGKGQLGIEYLEPIANTNFIDLAIARIWDISKQYMIPLNRIGFDLTGVGQVFQYALEKYILDSGAWGSEWKRGMRPYMSLSSTVASDIQIFVEAKDGFFPAKELCTSPAVEDWLSVRSGVVSRQIFNIPDSVLREMYSRRLIGKGLGGNDAARLKLEEKKSLKKRNIKSPDAADAFAVAMGVARRNGFVFEFSKHLYYGEKLGQAYYMAEQENKIQGVLENVLGMLGIGGVGEGSGGYGSV